MKEEAINEMTMTIKAKSINESFARACVASFCIQAEPSLDEITDIKTAVSEAVTNSVVHAYPNQMGLIEINVKLFKEYVQIKVSDFGIGIEDLEKAREPFFTTKPDEERSGMGFTVMESFMDKTEVIANTGKGTTIIMEKHFKHNQLLASGGGLNA